MPRFKRRAAWLTFVMICSALVACGGASFDELGADLDGLQVPDDWRLEETLTNGPGGDIECVPGFNGPSCPMLTRYYVSGEDSALDVVTHATEMLTEAEFTMEVPPSDPCDRMAGGSLCSVHASAGDRRVWVQVWSPDYEFSDVSIEDRSGPIVSVSVWREDPGS